MTVVLMYHALYRGSNTSLIDNEDLPYAVSEKNFIEQMQLLIDRRVGLLDSVELPEIVLTFDDGHISNHDIALPILNKLGFPAYMFITSDFVGVRENFCDPAHLVTMAKYGMRIGAHGTSHSFFDDLDEQQSDLELRLSRESLCAHSGKTVTSMSFPGGRYTSQVLKQAGASGYIHLFGSAFGIVTASDLMNGQPLNRVAIRRSTSLDDFSRIVNADSRYYTVQKGKQRLKLMLKRALGNHLYHGLYKSIASR